MTARSPIRVFAAAADEAGADAGASETPGASGEAILFSSYHVDDKTRARCIIPDDGMKDVFIHKSLLDKLELEELEAGTRVKVTLKIVDKGREAVNLDVIR